MRERISGRRARLHVALAGAVVLVMACGASSAFAQNAQDDDDELMDTKIFRRVMKEFGFQRDEGDIEYRERSPLVVPPSRSLPPPRDEKPLTTANPAWPKDPDVKRRQEATITPSQKARIMGDRSDEATRPMRPDEYSIYGRGTPGAGGENTTAETADRPLPPKALGSDRNLWDIIKSDFGPARPEYMPFPGETPRATLTAPPSGYQTPAPSQPYGLTPTVERGKAKTLEDRTPGYDR
jgi:hypothetical protein